MQMDRKAPRASARSLLAGLGDNMPALPKVPARIDPAPGRPPAILPDVLDLPATMPTVPSAPLATRDRVRPAPGGSPSRPVPIVVADAPYCLVLLDRSISMRTRDWPPNRLQVAKDAIVAYSRHLAARQPQARLGIIIFCHMVHTLCDFQIACHTDYFHRALLPVNVHMGTNIGHALQVAHQMIAGVPAPRHVVLLTDGGQLGGAAARSQAQSLKAIAHIECIGIGRRAKIDEALMRDIASTSADGSAAYRWIGSREQLVTHMEQTADRICRR